MTTRDGPSSARSEVEGALSPECWGEPSSNGGVDCGIGVLPRRRFLALGAASLLLPGIDRLLALPLPGLEPGPVGSPAAPSTEAPVERMSVGFVRGSEDWSGYTALAWPSEDAQTTVVPAGSLLLGDQELAGGLVELRVHGLYPDSASLLRQTVDSVRLEVLFPSPIGDTTSPIPHIAWSCSMHPVHNEAAPSRTVVPLGPLGELDLRAEVAWRHKRPLRRDALGAAEVVAARSAGSDTRRYASRFTVDAFGDNPRLQRGVYLLGLGHETWRMQHRLARPLAGAGADRLSLLMSVERFVLRAESPRPAPARSEG